MADTDRETAPGGAPIEFESNPLAEAALKAAADTPQPFAAEERETGIAALLTALVGAVELGVNRTMAATHRLAVRAMQDPEFGIMATYAHGNRQMDTFSYVRPSHSPDEPETTVVHAPNTVTFALEYLDLWLRAAEADETKRPAVDAARAIQARLRSPDLGPEAHTVIRERVLAGAAQDILTRERGELVLTVSGEHRGLYTLANAVHTHYQQHGFLHPDHVRELLSHFGFAEHIETVLGHVSGAVLREVQRLPLAGDFTRRVMGLVAKLRDKQGAIGSYINAEVDNAVFGLAGLSKTDKLNAATIQTAVDTLDDFAAFCAAGIIPPGVDRAEVAHALLALMVLDDPQAIFASNDLVTAQTRERLKFIAIFDWSEVEADSLLGTAARRREEAKARQAAGIVGPLVVKTE